MTQIPLRDALERAAKMEHSAADYYAKAAEATRLPGGGDVFRRLAEAASAHAKKLQGAHEGVGAEGDQAVEFDEEVEKKTLNPWPEITTLNAHVFALKNEGGSSSFYTQLANSTSSAESKKLLEELAQDEKSHHADVIGWFDNIDSGIAKRET